MNALKMMTLGAALAFAVTAPADAAPAPNAKLWSGTWELNAAKSKFTAPDFSEKSETRTYVVSGHRVTMHSSFTSGSGKSVKWSYSAAWDGKAYPAVGNTNADHIMLTPVNDREVKSRTTLHGKASATSTAKVSADGKQLTMTRSILTAKGGPTDDTLVFDRVK
jgi:Tol biopolymer transport system component